MRTRSPSLWARARRWGRMANKPCQSDLAVQQRTTPSTAEARATSLSANASKASRSPWVRGSTARARAYQVAAPCGSESWVRQGAPRRPQRPTQLALGALAHAGPQVEQLLPAPRCREEIEDRRHGPRVAGRGFQNLGQRRDGTCRILELVAFHLGHAHEIGATLDP